MTAMVSLTPTTTSHWTRLRRLTPTATEPATTLTPTTTATELTTLTTGLQMTPASGETTTAMVSETTTILTTTATVFLTAMTQTHWTTTMTDGTISTRLPVRLTVTVLRAHQATTMATQSTQVMQAEQSIFVTQWMTMTTMTLT